MIDISESREAYHLDDISEFCHVRGAKNISDGLTKKMHQAAFLDILRKGIIAFEVTQWFILDAG